MWLPRLSWKLMIVCGGASLLSGAAIGIALARYDLPSELSRSVLWIVAVVTLGTTGIAFWIANHLTRPVASLRLAADAMTRGDYRQRVYVSNRDEVGALARSFNRMSGELEGRISALHENLERQATVLGGMIEGVIAVDQRERIVFANAAAGRLFDFQPAAVEGRKLLEAVRNHTLHEAVVKALATREPLRLETEWDVDGRFTVAIQATPLPGNPCPGAVLVLHDVTELRRLESLRQEFVANVSHELKTPLTSIKAYAETLLNGALNEPETSRKFVARIEEQADRLHLLIQDLLSLARIESEQQAFDIVAVPVAEVVSECLEAHRAAADAKRIEMAAGTNCDPLRMQADREGLREIVDNLVGNAVKYSLEGGQVAIRWQARDGFARLEVQDAGIGIDAQELPRVFERFYRVDRARSRELGGTGLGLSIVKHLAQSFGGRVGAESRVGQGSTFWVELPLAN